MVKRVKTIIWKCLEKCPKKCELATRDVAGKLDGKHEVEEFPTLCPNGREVISVAWEAHES